jgi:hypothetical protein
MTSDATTSCPDGEEAADEDLPRPGRQQVVRGVGVDEALVDGQGEARGRRRDEGRRPHPDGHPRGDHEHQGEEEVELLLDGEAPGVQERLEVRGEVPVARRQPEQQVVARDEGRDERLPVVLELVGQHHRGRHRRRHQQHDDEGREDATRAPHEVAPDGEATEVTVAQGDARRQVAADDEEDVDARAAQPAEPGVRPHRGEDGDGAEAVELGSVAEGDHPGSPFVGGPVS